MKFCPIPPIPNLHDFESTGMHLCLAHLVDDQSYVNYYWNQSKAGDYVILDNGAHEGHCYDLHRLLQMARLIGAKEIVLPDALHDPDTTLRYFYEAMDLLESNEYTEVLMQECGYPRLMFVPQVRMSGDPFREFLRMSNRMSKRALLTTNDKLQFTMGMPYRYDQVSGGIYSLLDRITWSLDETGIDIHILGWPRDLNVPIDVAHDFPGVRSCDSSKPFVFALSGLSMERSTKLMDSKYPGRSNDYFTKALTMQEVELARSNVEFCVSSLEYGNMPTVPQSTETVPTEDGAD